MLSIEQVGVPQAADSLLSLCFPLHSLSSHPHTHSINCETYWAFEWTNEDPVSFNRLILCLTRTLVKGKYFSMNLRALVNQLQDDPESLYIVKGTQEINQRLIRSRLFICLFVRMAEFPVLTVDWLHFILWTHTDLDGWLETELIQIHSKLLIADDRAVIIGHRCETEKMLSTRISSNSPGGICKGGSEKERKE